MTRTHGGSGAAGSIIDTQCAWEGRGGEVVVVEGEGGREGKSNWEGGGWKGGVYVIGRRRVCVSVNDKTSKLFCV